MTVIRVEGLDVLARRLRELPDRVRRVALIRAVKAAAEPIVVRAKALAPKDTGTLVQNIGVRFTRRGAGRVSAQIGVFARKLSDKQRVAAHARARKRGKERASYRDLNDPFYARFVEVGTSKMAARPFLRPAFEMSKDAAVRIQADVIRVEIEAAART